MKTKEQTQVDPELWVDDYGDYLYRYAYSRLRDANAAEEVIQDTFMAGIRYRSQFAGKGSERGWLLCILKRKIVDYVRLRSRYARDGASEEQDPTLQLFDENGRWRTGAFPLVTPESQLEADELQQIVQQCLQHLPQGQADVFVLSVMEEMDSDQICRELNILPANLWVRLHRARLGLAKCLGSKWFQ